ncbi:hypothetical protein L465_00433 [Enterobacter sp. BIDMC 29]|nr:hypothetical protein L465_00433 [Enterobacter sp. BIDMC 29]
MLLWLEAITKVSKMPGLPARNSVSFTPSGIFRNRDS